ncbi:protein kinase [Ramlibacter sp. AN1015]|uniref:protein kinase domain-containing protein n=1 Tax=Ramlibacter sp. AN1015 TaxID=3133428 RepID=UPI0030C11F78
MTFGAPPPQPRLPLPSDTAALPLGTLVQEYRLERVLGVGGFGITYLARDAHLDLPVALKEFFPAELVARRPDGTVQARRHDSDAAARFRAGLQRFVEEARALAMFRHPHIVRVLRFFEANGTSCIVMEYESGQSLREWVRASGAPSQVALLALVEPLLDGLEAVHRAGFLHRDIKPDNIFVRSEGSPVLIDFGAARRHFTGGPMTNLVSPGFAPFEQYHSGGQQGPWTDIYALGAVMYWLVSGERPIDAAARVRQDTMAPARTLPAASAFDPAVLHAIDWAMAPHEDMRPRSVPQLRAALFGTPPLRAAAVRPPPARDAGAVRPASPPPDPAASSAFAAYAGKRNLLCTMLFIDLVGYSTRPVDEQVAAKEALNRLLALALRGMDEADRLGIDTGDGAVICFVGDPEEMLHAALMLARMLPQFTQPRLEARVGLHLGLVRVVHDLNGRLNVVGDGINAAQRIMDFANPNQVLVSTAYHEVICCVCDAAVPLFQFVGPFRDKHGRVHEVHAIVPQAHAAAVPAPAPWRASARQRVADAPLLPGPMPPAIARDMDRYTGPLSRVLVEKVRRGAGSLENLRRALAAAVPVSLRLEKESTQSEAPALHKAPHAQRPLARRQLVELERLLTQHIGPLARMLLARELDQHGDTAELVSALAAHIDDQALRDAFRASAKRELRL